MKRIKFLSLFIASLLLFVFFNVFFNNLRAEERTPAQVNYQIDFWYKETLDFYQQGQYVEAKNKLNKIIKTLAYNPPAVIWRSSHKMEPPQETFYKMLKQTEEQIEWKKIEQKQLEQQEFERKKKELSRQKEEKQKQLAAEKAKHEQELKAKQEALAQQKEERLRQEAELKAKHEQELKAKQEALAQQKEERLRQEAELKAKHEQELKAKQEALAQQKEERLRQEAELKAKHEQELKAKQEALAQQKEERLRQEAELKAKHEQELKAKQEALAQQKEERLRQEAELKAKHEQELKAKQEALAQQKEERLKQQQELKAKREQELKAREEEKARAETERKAKEAKLKVQKEKEAQEKQLKLEAERKAKEEALSRQKVEKQRQLAAEKAKREQELKAREEEKARAETERKAKEAKLKVQKEKEAREKQLKLETERKAKEEEFSRQKKEKQRQLAAEKAKREQELKAREEEKARAETERKAKEAKLKVQKEKEAREKQLKLETERKAKEEEFSRQKKEKQRQLAAEKAKREQELKAKQEALAKQKEERLKQQQELKAREEEKARAEAERKAKEVEPKVKKQKETQEKQLKLEAERRAKEEVLAKQKEERLRQQQELDAKQEQERKAREEEKARAETERKAKEEELTKQKVDKEKQQQELKAKQEQERKAREEEKARAETERKAKEEELTKQKVDKEKQQQELKAKQEQERKAREEEKARAETERKTREEELAQQRLKQQVELEAERQEEQKAKQEELAREREKLEIKVNEMKRASVQEKVMTEAMLKKHLHDQAKIKKIEKLWISARRLYEQGMYEEAIKEFDEIIKLEGNPRIKYTPSALKYIEKAKNNLIQKKQVTLFKEVEEIEKEMMNEVLKQQVPPYIEPPQHIEQKEPSSLVEPPAIRKKLIAAKVTMDFDKVGLKSVIAFLSQESGINFIASQKVLDLALVVSARFKETSLDEVIKYITKNLGLIYRIDKEVVWVAHPEEIANEPMETRVYYLNKGGGLFTEFSPVSSGTTETGLGGSSAQITKVYTIEDTLKEVVPWPSDSKISYDKRINALLVRNTPQNLQMLEEMLYSLDIEPLQVLIEARFLEVDVTDTKELGLDWSIPGGDYMLKDRNGASFKAGIGKDSGVDFSTFARAAEGLNLTYKGMLTNSQFQTVLHALEETKKIKTLSSPRITTLNNQLATMKVVDEWIYPTRYEYEIVQFDLNGDGDYSDAGETTYKNVPKDFMRRDVGILLKVIPSVGADKKTISLSLIPEVSEGVADGFTYTGDVKLPKFTSRNLSTTVVVESGETVVLGGMIRESSTKTITRVPVLGNIPLLGAFFRKNTDSIERKNLLIFVTAKVLSSSGEEVVVAQK